MALCGADLDDLFAYQTPKVVVLKDKWLGLFRLALMVTVVFYIVVWMILYKGDHLSSGDVDGVFRVSLKHPTMDACDPEDIGCLSNYTPLTALKYCTQSPDKYESNDDGVEQAKGNCQDWDSVEATLNINQGILLPTRVRRYQQQRGCNPGPSNGWTCEGVPYDYLDGSEIQTKPGKPEAYYDAFVADIEGFALLFDHQFRKYGGMQKDDYEMNGWWNDCPHGKALFSECTPRLIPCAHEQCPTNSRRVPALPSPSFLQANDGRQAAVVFEKGRRLKAADRILPGGEPIVGAPKGDLFLVSSLLDAAKVDLDTTEGYIGKQKTLRHRGLVLVVHIQYGNKPSGGWMGLKVTPWTTPEPYYTYHISTREAFDYKVTKTFNDPSDVKRIIRVYNGIRVVVEQSGTILMWDTSQFLVTMTAALGLIAVATTVTELAMMYVMSKREEYKKRKYHHSCDFDPAEPKKDPTTFQEAGENVLEALDSQDGKAMAKALRDLLDMYRTTPESGP